MDEIKYFLFRVTKTRIGEKFIAGFVDLDEALEHVTAIYTGTDIDYSFVLRRAAADQRIINTYTRGNWEIEYDDINDEPMYLVVCQDGSETPYEDLCETLEQAIEYVEKVYSSDSPYAVQIQNYDTDEIERLWFNGRWWYD